MLSICDSIAKHVKVDRVQVRAYRGHTILQVADRLKFSTLPLEDFDIIILHVGANDIGNMAHDTTFFTVMDRFKLLVDFIKLRNRKCKILIFGLIPRPVDFLGTQPLLWGVNNALQSWCCLHQYLIFVPIQKSFLIASLPRVNLYSTSDLLHLNGLGVECFERWIRQAISVKNIKARSHWRKRPLIGHFGGGRTYFWVAYPST